MFFNAMQPAIMMETAMKTYLKNMDAMARPSRTQMKSAARAQIELGGFVAKRMKANIELPKKYAACVTPADVMGTTVAFWMTCFEDYAETAQRAGQAVGMAPADPISRIKDWQPPVGVETPAEPADRARDTLDLDDAPKFEDLEGKWPPAEAIKSAA